MHVAYMRICLFCLSLVVSCSLFRLSSFLRIYTYMCIEKTYKHIHRQKHRHTLIHIRTQTHICNIRHIRDIRNMRNTRNMRNMHLYSYYTEYVQ